MLDESVVIEVSGSQLLAALENGLEQWPQHEGRFPQARLPALSSCCCCPA